MPNGVASDTGFPVWRCQFTMVGTIAKGPKQCDERATIKCVKLDERGYPNIVDYYCEAHADRLMEIGWVKG